MEIKESHCYSSPRYDHRLQSLLTNCLYSCCDRCRCGSKVGHSFWSVTPHVQWPQPLLNVQKSLTSYRNRTRRGEFCHPHALWLRQRHTGQSGRCLPYSYFLTFPSIDQPVGFGWAYNYILGRKILYNFVIFLYYRRKTSQWHKYSSPRNHTPIIDYREWEQEIDWQLTSKSNYQWTYNWVFRDRTYKSTCFLCSKVKTMALTTSSFESYCHKVYSRGIYTQWVDVHSLYPGQSQTKVYQSSSQAHHEALWTCTLGCVRSLLYTNLWRKSIFYTIHRRLNEIHIHMAAPK